MITVFAGKIAYDMFNLIERRDNIFTIDRVKNWGNKNYGHRLYVHTEKDRWLCFIAVLKKKNGQYSEIVYYDQHIDQTGAKLDALYKRVCSEHKFREWKLIPYWDDKYEVNRQGDVRNASSKRVIFQDKYLRQALVGPDKKRTLIDENWLILAYGDYITGGNYFICKPDPNMMEMQLRLYEERLELKDREIRLLKKESELDKREADVYTRETYIELATDFEL